MRRVYKARIVPDSAPDGMTTKVIKVEDLGVPIAAALGDWEALTDDELAVLSERIGEEFYRRGLYE